MDMTEREFIYHAEENKCSFLFESSKSGNGLCIAEVNEYFYEEGWDDEDDPVPGDVVLPDSIDGIPIVEIGKDAFDREPGIVSLRLPDSLQIVREHGLGHRSFMIPSIPNQLRIAESYSFSGTNILSDVFPQSLEEIGEYAFYGCSGLKTIYLQEGLIMLSDGAFCGCRDLTHVSLPASLSLIGEEIFCGCTSLQSIELSDGLTALSMVDNALIRNEDQTLIALIPRCDSGVLRIPDGVRRIGAYAFSNRSEIVSVILPDSIKEIGQGGFEGCSSLCEIVFGSELVHIGAEAFKDCTSLTGIKLPDSVIEVGKSAFANCKALKTVSVSQRIKHIDISSFHNCTLSDFVIRGNVPPPVSSLKALVDGSQRCDAEIYAMIAGVPYRFMHEDGKDI